MSASSASRFGFGRNWSNYVTYVNEDRIRDAEDSVRRLLEVPDLSGKTFLDAGCGSGLFSLAAVRLGAARVHSFDYDADSVAAAKHLRDRYAADAPWTIERGDVLDRDWLGELGSFDVVYSWGVLHHTGALWQALDNVLGATQDDGLLVVSVYNDQGQMSKYWVRAKRVYNRLPRFLRIPYAVTVALPLELRSLLGAVVRGRPGDYIRSWTHGLDRGMSRWHDLLDWVGGYPFEVATPAEVVHFLRQRGFGLVGLATVGGSHGCNEFVFERLPGKGSFPALRAIEA